MQSDQIYDLLSFDLSSFGLFLATSSSPVTWLLAPIIALIFCIILIIVISTIESIDFVKNLKIGELQPDEADSSENSEKAEESKLDDFAKNKANSIVSLLAVCSCLVCGFVIYFSQSSRAHYEAATSLKFKDPEFLSSVAKSISSKNYDTFPDFLQALDTSNCYTPNVLSSDSSCDMAGIDLVLKEYLKYPLTVESSKLLTQSKKLLDSPQVVISSVLSGDLPIGAISSFGKNLKIKNRVQFENLFIRNLSVGRLSVAYSDGETSEVSYKLSGRAIQNENSIGLVKTESEKIAVEPVTLNKMAEDIYNDCAGLLSSTCFSFKKFYVEKVLPDGSSVNSMSKAELLKTFNESVLRADKAIAEVK